MKDSNYWTKQEKMILLMLCTTWCINIITLVMTIIALLSKQ